MGTRDETIMALAAELQRSYCRRGRTLAVAESCTGGLLAAALTAVPGSSAYFKGGVVAYANELKQELLGVTAESLLQYGAVSVAVARQMAEGAAARCGADTAIALTGIAGPAGGTDAKPVGTVYIAVCDGEAVRVEKFVFAGDREAVRGQSVRRGLELLLGKAPARVEADRWE